jgi:hypothetical protein
LKPRAFSGKISGYLAKYMTKTMDLELCEGIEHEFSFFVKYIVSKQKKSIKILQLKYIYIAQFSLDR